MAAKDSRHKQEFGRDRCREETNVPTSPRMLLVNRAGNHRRLSVAGARWPAEWRGERAVGRNPRTKAATQTDRSTGGRASPSRMWALQCTTAGLFELTVGRGAGVEWKAARGCHVLMARRWKKGPRGRHGLTDVSGRHGAAADRGVGSLGCLWGTELACKGICLGQLHVVDVIDVNFPRDIALHARRRRSRSCGSGVAHKC